MIWTKDKLRKETEEMQIRPDDKIERHGLQPPRRKGGRPKKAVTVKTNLDLSPELLEDLDSIAEYMGAARQAVIKGFILAGINDFYKSRAVKKSG